jgi:phosphate-selective porin
MRRNWKKWLAFVLVLGMVAASAAIAGEAEVTGTIAESGKDIVIQADDGAEYKVMGKDLSAMVGKKVTAKGTLAEADGQKTITVIDVKPVE